MTRPLLTGAWRARAVAALAGIAGFGLARSAEAQGYGLPQGPAGFTGPRTGDTTPLGDSGIEPRARSPQSVKLFDSERSQLAYELDVGPLWNRRIEDSTPTTERSNFKRGAPLAGELALGTIYTTPAGPFFLVGHQKTLFRILDDKSFSWAVFHQEMGGGLKIGPLEPEARIRLGILTADIIHAQPSVQLLSPGVSAGIGFHVGKIRLDFRGNADFLWRWFGPNYFVRSITIGFRLDQPHPEPFPRTP